MALNIMTDSFDVFAPGIGAELGGGGRYDHLMGRFGRTAASSDLPWMSIDYSALSICPSVPLRPMRPYPKRSVGLRRLLPRRVRSRA